VLQNLEESRFPRNIYNLTKNYFSKRRATMATINIKLERAVCKGCPQCSCLWPAMWNIFFNSLLKLMFTCSTNIIAFADDLLLLTRGETVSEIENIANLELTKPHTGQGKTWSDSTKEFEAMLMTRRKRKEGGVVEVYLEKKFLRQVKTMKYLGRIIDKN